MTKEDYIDLIKVAECIVKINNICKQLTNYPLDYGECGQVYLLWDVLRRHADFQFQETGNLETDCENVNSFMDILENEKLTPEEKYNMLFKEEKDNNEKQTSVIKQPTTNTGKVSMVNQYGVFIRLSDGTDCFCEFPLNSIPSVGTMVKIKVTHINPKTNQIYGTITRQ